MVTIDTIGTEIASEHNRAIGMLARDSDALATYLRSGARAVVFKRGTRVCLVGSPPLGLRVASPGRNTPIPSGLRKIRIPEWCFGEYYVARETVRRVSHSEETIGTPEGRIRALRKEIQGFERVIARYEKRGDARYVAHYAKLLDWQRLELATAYWHTGEAKPCIEQLDLIPGNSEVRQYAAPLLKELASGGSGSGKMSVTVEAPGTAVSPTSPP